MNAIRANRGVHTWLAVDLSEFDFDGIKKVVLTIKNSTNVKDRIVLQREFTETGYYNITVTPEESMKLKDGAVYDINIIRADGDTFKIGENGAVELWEGVGT